MDPEAEPFKPGVRCVPSIRAFFPAISLQLTYRKHCRGQLHQHLNGFRWRTERRSEIFLNRPRRSYVHSPTQKRTQMDVVFQPFAIAGVGKVENQLAGFKPKTVPSSLLQDSTLHSPHFCVSWT